MQPGAVPIPFQLHSRPESLDKQERAFFELIRQKLSALRSENARGLEQQDRDLQKGYENNDSLFISTFSSLSRHFELSKVYNILSFLFPSFI
jgi:hypothetical protein